MSPQIELTLPSGGRVSLRPVTPEDEIFLINLTGARARRISHGGVGWGQKESSFAGSLKCSDREYERVS